MRLGLSQSARLEQRLIQSPQMIQTMQILQLSSLELDQRTEQELMENPFLERADLPAGDLAPSADGESTNPGPEDPAADRDGSWSPPERVGREEADRRSVAEEFDRLWSLEEQGPRGPLNYEASDRKQEALANTPDRPRTLAAALCEELAGIDLSDRQRELAEFLIFSLDERGYLTEPLNLLAQDRVLTEELTELERQARQQESDSESLGNGVHAPANDPREPGPATGAAPREPAPEEVEATVEELEEVLEKLRTAIHPALGAQELKEALRLQLEARGWDTPLMLQLVDEHLEDVVKNRLPRIVKATGCDLEELKESIERLRELDLSPGGDYDEDLAAVINPDVVVEELDGRFEVRLARERRTGLRISPVYRELLDGLEEARDEARSASSNGSTNGTNSHSVAASQDPAAPESPAAPGAADVESTPPTAPGAAGPDERPAPGEPADADPRARSNEPVDLDDPEEARRWARRKLESARWFIEAVEQRESTMLRIAKVIFARQERFLVDGPKALQPLRMQEVADETGVHISTVSRAVAGKYGQTPRGIHPLKYFFTSGTTDSSGEAQSQVGIRQRLAEMVQTEDPQNPLSDDQIAAELMKREGIRLARRTVTKYRLALGIPSSSQRKRF